MRKETQNYILKLEERKAYLEHMLEKLEEENTIQKSEISRLRVQKYGDDYQYYLRSDKKDTCGKYLKRGQVETARMIAQQDYDYKIVNRIRDELSMINRYLGKNPPQKLDEIYGKMSEGRKKLVKPIDLPDDEYIEGWLQKPYQGKGFTEETPEYYTDKGERVRSKSEIIIANTLHKYNIPYRYEYPIMLKGLGIVYPDFTALDIRNKKEIYIEHLGMLDDMEYSEKAMDKIIRYELNQIYLGDRLMITYESKTHPLNVRLLEKKIESFFL